MFKLQSHNLSNSDASMSTIALPKQSSLTDKSIQNVKCYSVRKISHDPSLEISLCPQQRISIPFVFHFYITPTTQVLGHTTVWSNFLRSL